MADIEVIKSFHAVKSYLSVTEQDELAIKLGLTEEDKGRRLQGFEVELEFYLILYALNACKHMVGLDGAAAQLTDTASPDGYLEFKNGLRILVEIKNEETGKFKMSNGRLRRQIQFAESLNIPLYYAIRFKNTYWTLFPSALLEYNNGKLLLERDYKLSVFERVAGSKYFIFPKGIALVSTFSKKENKGESVFRGNFGEMVSYEIYYQNNLIFKLDRKAVNSSIFLEALHGAIRHQNSEVVETNGDITVVTEELMNDTVLTDYSFSMTPIEHTIANLGNFYDVTAFYKECINDKNILLQETRRNIYEIIKLLQTKNVPIKIVLSSEISQEKVKFL